MNKRNVVLMIAVMGLAGCAAGTGYHANTSGQTGRAESVALSGGDRADEAQANRDRAERRSKGGN